ncbi:DUF1013 domain-containing protein [Rhodospirillum rubrum]|uniref:Cytoplasmic protein n=1 Tax=Rhodospirillum rubrum (strain ATCC 11170 / ATH 1.1.1 / DSM 467 / LMG 4362 / NCIMB 8255 / S1) TaxID=269796 RepID=Q2RVI9_RHORT|nr:DUF1013 domain-containing protein [Rhodospirillum rubrum]ABC21856.1 Protein of unknown function DUF1013 [Rhodospirillum rubrum ATCC 11170]AEO47557.1 putative cytoplasmic protein [Rhodospirillum rubrum F11]MBK5953419.1 cytoplasmic protein [Rhodospirillum rubrum]QXG81516.1 DUF1013 domain-containing protein [Rhodospirillum rubrum]HAQ01304.1 DUF1013 domain-containing protein [Rhodospirillum rubrum]
MALPLMPKATAVWLVENTTLTFEQIAEFCGMHELEVQAIADDEVAVGITGMDPVVKGQLLADEIARCEANPTARLKLRPSENPIPQARQKGTRYTPVSKRHDRPDGIAWILKNHPEVTEAQICKLLGTTKPTIGAIRDRSHWNAQNIKPRNPVTLGLCSEADLEKAIALSGNRRSLMAQMNATYSESAASVPPAYHDDDDEDDRRI